MDWQSLWLSIRVAACASFAAGSAGLLIATVLSRRRSVASSAIDALFSVPMVLPPTVLGYALLVALGRTSVIGRAYEGVFGEPIVFTTTGAVVAAFVGALPLVIKGARAALEEVDPTLVGVARTLGATRWSAWWTVELPLARRGIAAAWMLGFARALGDFGATLMLAGDIPGQTRTAALAMYDAVQAGRHAQATGLAVVLGAIAVAVMLFVSALASPRRAHHGR